MTKVPEWGGRLYDRPAFNGLTKSLIPPTRGVIDAVARRDQIRVLVDGLTAANTLNAIRGARWTYLHATLRPQLEAIIGAAAARTGLPPAPFAGRPRRRRGEQTLLARYPARAAAAGRLRAATSLGRTSSRMIREKWHAESLRITTPVMGGRNFAGV